MSTRRHGAGPRPGRPMASRYRRRLSRQGGFSSPQYRRTSSRVFGNFQLQRGAESKRGRSTLTPNGLAPARILYRNPEPSDSSVRPFARYSLAGWVSTRRPPIRRGIKVRKVDRTPYILLRRAVRRRGRLPVCRHKYGAKAKDCGPKHLVLNEPRRGGPTRTPPRERR